MQRTISPHPTPRRILLAKGDNSLPDGEWEPIVPAALRDARFGVTAHDDLWAHFAEFRPK